MNSGSAQKQNSGFRPHGLLTNHRNSLRESYRLLMVASTAVVLGLMIIGLVGANIV